jgi:oligosaccharide repeat unit polymerase
MNLKILYIVFIILLVFYYADAPVVMDKSVMFVLLSVNILSIFLFIYKKENKFELKKQLFKFSTLFILGFSIVHFQYYLDFLLDNVDIKTSYIWINRTVVIKSFILSTVGLLSFFIGYILIKKTKVLNSKKQKANSTKFLVLFATLMLLLFIATVNPLYLAGFYGEVEMGTTATYAILLFKLLFFSAIIQNCRNMIFLKRIPSSIKEYINSQGYIISGVLCVYLLLVLISGDRGPLISFTICYFSGYYIVTKKKLSIKKGFTFLMLGAIFMTLLGEVRRSDKNIDFTTRLQRALNEEKTGSQVSFLPQTQELAGSVRTLHTAVNYIPEKHDFLYGRFQFQQISASIPFFNMFLPIFYDSGHVKYKGSSSFVTWINQGDYPNSGDGTSCITDFYFDFGIFGVIVGMFLFGLITRYFEVNLFCNYNISPLFIHIFGIIYLSNAIYIPRSSILFELRTVIWITLILMFNSLIKRNKLS